MPDIFVDPSNQTPEPEKAQSPLSPVKPVAQKQQGARSVLTGPAKPLSALMIDPEGVYFQTQDKDETVIMLLRKHWVTNVPWILVGVSMLLAPFLVSVITSPFSIPIQLPFRNLLVGVGFWYLLSFGYLFINFIIWYFNAYLVTNERVLDIDFFNLTYKQVSATRLERIQDVSFNMGGVLRSIFNYGDVFIQTAGEEENFDFLAVPQPARVADKIGELMEKAGSRNL